jgi:ribose transport system substrate-binding protein
MRTASDQVRIDQKPGDLSLSLFCSSFNMFFSRAGSQAALQPGSLARALAREISRLTSLGLAFLLITAVAGRVSSQSVDPVQALAALQGKTLSKGPNGEEPAPASSVSLSPEEIEKIRGLKAKAAIVLHYSRNDWSEAQVAGLKSQFDKMGIEVTAVTDAGFIAERQVANIESVLMQKPQIIVSIPTDAVFTAAAYKKASQQGVKLVFMDNVPQGFEPGKDYVSVVSADNYGNGVASAHLMAKALQSKGEIGLVYHAADFFVTRQRYDAFKKTITENYPDIRIVAEQGIREPDFYGDADRAAYVMLTANQNLSGIWAVWDVPAEGVIAAARTAGKEHLVITTIDLGLNVAVDMAQNGLVKGVGAQRPYDQGIVEALLAGYGLLGKPAPAYVALPALPVTRENLLEAWKTVYHTEAPGSVENRMK